MRRTSRQEGRPWRSTEWKDTMGWACRDGRTFGTHYHISCECHLVMSDISSLCATRAAYTGHDVAQGIV